MFGKILKNIKQAAGKGPVKIEVHFDEKTKAVFTKERIGYSGYLDVRVTEPVEAEYVLFRLEVKVKNRKQGVTQEVGESLGEKKVLLTTQFEPGSTGRYDFSTGADFYEFKAPHEVVTVTRGLEGAFERLGNVVEEGKVRYFLVVQFKVKGLAIPAEDKVELTYESS